MPINAPTFDELKQHIGSNSASVQDLERLVYELYERIVELEAIAFPKESTEETEVDIFV